MCCPHAHPFTYAKGCFGLVTGEDCRQDRQVSPLAVDCAFGVGGQKLGLLQAAIGPARLPMQLLNVTGGQLNEGCGSDFVEKQRQLPANFGNHLSRHRHVLLFPMPAFFLALLHLRVHVCVSAAVFAGISECAVAYLRLCGGRYSGMVHADVPDCKLVGAHVRGHAQAVHM